MTLSDAPDHQLVQWTLDGNSAAFDELGRRHRPSVLDAIEHLVHDLDLAEDLTQRAFIKAFTKLRTFRPGASFAPWILRIANRVTLDELKKEKRLRKRRLDTVPLDPTPHFSLPRRQAAARPHVSLPSDSTPTRPDPNEVRRVMQEAIAKLKGNQRRCTYLREIEGPSYEHIAERPGLTPRLAFFWLCTSAAVSHLAAMNRTQPIRDIALPAQRRAIDFVCH